MVNLYAKLISGGASLLVQVLLVIGAVLAFMWWDPFGIVSPQKQMLRDTPAQVESIKKLGELITAEYYGEVVSSLGEVADSTIEAQVDNFEVTTEDFHAQFVLALEEFIETQPDIKNNFKNKFEQSVSGKEIAADDLYSRYTFYLWTQLAGKDYDQKKFEKEKKLGSVELRALYRKLYKNKNGWRDKLKALKTSAFVSVYRETIDRESKKTYRKTRLAMVGRGWIKAGIDFEEFTEENFIYNEDHQTIHFIGFEPKIISATINPWFIPKKGVEGFEFLIANRKVKMRPDYVKQVKQQCLDKLKDQALRKGIKEKAMENAADYLKGFFSLLLDTEIKRVAFHKNQLSSIAEFILMDDVITNDEIVWLNDALLGFKHKNESKRGWEQPFRTFVDSITAFHRYQLNTTNLYLNSKSELLFKVLGDGKIDSADVVRLGTWNTHTELDSLWYFYGLPDAEFDESIQVLENQFKQDLAKLISDDGTPDLHTAISNTLSAENQKLKAALQELFKPDSAAKSAE